MDFSIIEGLTDEELNELYDDNVIKDPYNINITTCHCYTSTGWVAFGAHLWHSPRYRCSDSTVAGCGYCAMQSFINSYDKCRAWCRRHAVDIWYVDPSCTCIERGGHYHASFSTCSR